MVAGWYGGERVAERDRQEEERKRRRHWEDQEEALNLEERREVSRSARALEAKRLDPEEKRLPVPVPAPHLVADGTTIDRSNGVPSAAGPAPAPHPRPDTAVLALAPAPTPTLSQRYGDLAYRVPAPAAPAPQDRAEADHGPAAAPAVAPRAHGAQRPRPGPAGARRARPGNRGRRPARRPPRITARVDQHQDDKPAAPADSQNWERPAPAADPVKDWDLPALPADCAPVRAPELLTDTQVVARMNYGLDQGWTQRRIGELAGRSATLVNRHKQKRGRGL
ncbi:hypothetical protein ACFV7Q_38390 [Streptomyces sp. NPDC059851]|uniref:hypothetical protein n=1 Tax=Streptomyces sp. NPDC059851 TaxID=3346971 RepID=UPI00364EA4B1